MKRFRIPMTIAVGIATISIVSPSLGSSPGFIENRGQLDETVRYYMPGSLASVYFTDDAIVFDLYEIDAPQGRAPQAGHSRGPTAVEERKISRRGSAVWVHIEDFDPSMRIAVRDERVARHNYFVGKDAAQWRTDVPAYGEVVYRNVRPGVNLVFRDDGGRLTYEFISPNGVNPTRASFRYEGAIDVTADGDGGVIAETNVGSLHEVRQRGGMAGQFLRPTRSGGSGGDESARSDDRSLPLSTLLWSTFLGGSSSDFGQAVAVDPSGNLVITGSTISSSFPTTPGAYDVVYNGLYDVFVASLSSSGSSLLWSTFLGGSASDLGFDIALDPMGNPVVTGETRSFGFPTTQGAYDVSYNGDYDCFVAKLSPTGSNLLWSTFLGGSADERGNALTLDSSGGNPVLTGFTFSSNFPANPAAFDPSYDALADVFVAKLSSSGTALLWSTFLGGSGGEEGNDLALDAAGNPVVTGSTRSSGFPTTAGSYDVTYNGTEDVFVSKLSGSGSILLWSTFLGGTDSDVGYAVALDPAGDPALTGHTLSSNFPTTPGAYDVSFNSATDGFVAKLSSSGSNLLWSTFLGGSDGGDSGLNLALESCGNLVVTGSTGSSTFPTTSGAYDGSFNGSADAFVAELSSTGSSLLYGTFLGGSESDGAWGLVLNASGNPTVAVTGNTESPSFPTTPGAYDGSYNGDFEVFVGVLAVTGCVPTGQCCFYPVPSCLVVTEAECEALGGIYQGDGTDCSVPCPPLPVPCATDGYKCTIVVPGLSVPDNDPAGVTSTMTITETGVISDVILGIEMNHPWVGDLIASLTFQPACGGGTIGPVRVLCRQNRTNCAGVGGPFGCGLDLTTASDYLWSDAASAEMAEPCGTGTVVPSGCYLPDDDNAGNLPLSVFDGLDKAGCWILNVSDNSAGDTGTVVSWSICFLNEPVTGVSPENLAGLSKGTALYQNEPNPLSPTTKIVFDLGQRSQVRLRVFDVQGRLVRTLVDGQLDTQRHIVHWDGLDAAGQQVAAGVYFYRLEAPDYTATRKMVVLK